MNHLTRPKSHTQHRNAAAFRSRTQLITMCEITNKMLQNKVASSPKENMFSIFIIGKFCYLVDGYYNCSGEKSSLLGNNGVFRQTGVLDPENADSRFLRNARMRLLFYPEDKGRNFRRNAHSLSNELSHSPPPR